uniref:Protein BCCIP homolog n=1 Tax=Danio rerio TaxID=7955 RepID=BCCIP_DANRE|nr:RecName: Full=Protein BCCIP homolog [Danio rerio]AAH91454.1 BRCA2 and CDKN1A interacting protein [Danio rerio]AAI64248.1 Bccip protein [Danio rerio]
MASSAKRRAVETGQNPQDSDESSDEGLEDSGDDDSENSEEEVNEEVIVDFEAHTISDNDFHGIKTLLQQLFLKCHVNTSDLTDIIIQQNHIGSVIRQAEVPEDSDDEGDPDEVFGFISMVNLTERQGVECLEKLKDMILDQCVKCSTPDGQERMENLLQGNAQSVGLLLSERFVNVPPQIALPLHKQLQKEMAEAQRTNKPSGKCQFCLMISKTCKPLKKKSISAGDQAKDELLFVNDEEECFYEQATVKFSYCVQDEADSCATGKWSYDDEPMKPFRTVMVIPMDRMDTIMQKMTDYLTV